MDGSAAAEYLRERLETRLTSLHGCPVQVSQVRPLSGGASRETWAFLLTSNGRSQTLVLRRDPPSESGATSMGKEAAALESASRHGVPGPALVDWSTEAEHLGSPYLIMSHVEGETLAHRILREPGFAMARSRLAAQLGEAAARIHRIPRHELTNMPHEDGLDVIQRRYVETQIQRPVLDVAFKWLTDHRPERPEEVGLVHGDFRLGNVSVTDSGLTAILDWELSHLGDPIEDLGYLCVRAWRFGGPRPVAGVGTFEDLLDGYASISGRRPDRDRLRWWQIVGTLSWGVSCLSQFKRHRTGTTRSVELVAIGRRVAEQEHDLLTMMKEH